MNRLGEQVEGLRLTPWISALVSVAIAVLTSSLSVYGLLRSQRTDRRHRGQREAIYSAQDGLELLLKNWVKEKAWRESQKQSDPKSAATPQSPHKEQQLLISFQKHVSRIEDEKIRSVFNAWRETARHYFHGYEMVSLRDELELREQAIRLSGERARDLD